MSAWLQYTVKNEEKKLIIIAMNLQMVAVMCHEVTDEVHPHLRGPALVDGYVTVHSSLLCWMHVRLEWLNAFLNARPQP